MSCHVPTVAAESGTSIAGCFAIGRTRALRPIQAQWADVIVVGSNVIAYCWMPGERTEIAQRVRLRDPAWQVPILWRSEVRNALAGYLSRGTLKVDGAAAIMSAAE